MRPLVHKFSPLERMLLTAAVCTEMPAPPTGRALLLGGGPDLPSSRALLLGGGAAMTLDVQGGYRAVCGRSFNLRDTAPYHLYQSAGDGGRLWHVWGRGEGRAADL